LAHAVVDAVLGALAEGDIGRHFPPDDPQWSGADSGVFLAEARRLCDRAGARIVNVDSTVILQRPKLAPQIPQMCEALAKALGCESTQVSVKAKTAEGLGAVGEGVAVEARAIVLLEFSRTGD
jgi:2-C-methyl-D-erythritol 2,4-cyclodiphosphate synthase